MIGLPDFAFAAAGSSFSTRVSRPALGVKSLPLAATIKNFRTTIGMAVAFSARRSAAPDGDASGRCHLRENSFLGPKRPPESQRCSGVRHAKQIHGAFLGTRARG